MGRPPHRSPHTRRVLRALLRDPTIWRHGYDLAKETDLQSGTLYPILMRLAEHGLLEEDWEPSDTPGRPLRHIYRLTRTGLTLARELAATSARRVLRPLKATGR
ncbi:MAG TPA: PadR family transcriptional regulator [Vicinamibacterales bacterium]|nr:PadR family transcriptional regulator [Vicinamibacterales bacterium]